MDSFSISVVDRRWAHAEARVSVSVSVRASLDRNRGKVSVIAKMARTFIQINLGKYKDTKKAAPWVGRPFLDIVYFRSEIITNVEPDGIHFCALVLAVELLGGVAQEAPIISDAKLQHAPVKLPIEAHTWGKGGREEAHAVVVPRFLVLHDEWRIAHCCITDDHAACDFVLDVDFSIHPKNAIDKHSIANFR